MALGEAATHGCQAAPERERSMRDGGSAPGACLPVTIEVMTAHNGPGPDDGPRDVPAAIRHAYVTNPPV